MIHVVEARSRAPRWPATPRQAIAIQNRLRGRIRIGGRLGRVRLVAGADVAYDAGRGLLHAAVLVYAVPSMTLIEARAVRAPIRFPYVPGLLSFREAPALLRAIRRLRHRPDLLICDAQGIAHPRGIGLASHLGLLAGLPTIGCAKSRLLGEHGEPGPSPGDRAPLVHHGRRIGSVVRTRTRCRPLFISPGHRIGFEASVRWVLRCCRGYRLPEPVRQADLLVERLKRSEPPPVTARTGRNAVIESSRGARNDDHTAGASGPVEGCRVRPARRCDSGPRQPGRRERRHVHVERQNPGRVRGPQAADGA